MLLKKLNYRLIKLWHSFVYQPIKKTTHLSMDRRKYMLAVLSSVDNASYTPVQIQKIFFLLDKNIANKVGGPYFNFEPYHYGPFDKKIYNELNLLHLVDDVTEEKVNNVTRYSLTPSGIAEGKKELEMLNNESKKYIKEICTFVKSLSFAQLLRAIYNEYPEMKANSIFHP